MEKENQKVFEGALFNVNMTSNEDRMLVIKDDMDFSMFPIYINDHHNIHIKIEGTVRATKNYKEWPITSHGQYDHFM